MELRPFRRAGDFFRRIVVTGGNERPFQDENGVVFVGVIPFLLNPGIVMDDSKEGV